MKAFIGIATFLLTMSSVRADQVVSVISRKDCISSLQKTLKENSLRGKLSSAIAHTSERIILEARIQIIDSETSPNVRRIQECFDVFTDTPSDAQTCKISLFDSIYEADKYGANFNVHDELKKFVLNCF